MEFPNEIENDFDANLSRVIKIFYAGINHRPEEIFAAAESSADDDFYTKYLSSLFTAIESALSLDPQAIEKTLIKVNEASSRVNSFRKKPSSWKSWIPGLPAKIDYDAFSDIECHAELVYADLMVITAGCSAGKDLSSWVGILNGAYCINVAHNCYQNCFSILQNKTNWSSKMAKEHFESGVRLAIGCFDLMVSFVPSRFVKLVELAGFSGDRDFGLSQLKASESLTNGSRWPASALILGGYNLFLEYTYGLAEPDLELVEKIAIKCETMFPEVSDFIYENCLTFY